MFAHGIHRLIQVSMLVLSLCTSVVAYAQDAVATDEFTADVLFKKGRAELEAGNVVEACATIEASQKLVPRPGTLFTLAECYALAKRYATAVSTYDEFLRIVRDLPSEQQPRYADRVPLAEERKAEAAKSISLLVLVVPKDAPNNTIVLRDGVVVSDAVLRAPIPIDSGQHQIVVRVPGRPESRQSVTVGLGERHVVELIIPSPQPKASNRRAFVYGTLGLGFAGVLVGGVTGGLAVGAAQTAHAECNQYVCSLVGAQAVVDGRVMATVSNVGFVVGGIGLASSLVFGLTIPKTDKPISTSIMIDGSTMFFHAKGVF